jgi:putative protease
VQLKAGDGVMFDEGHPEQDEQGGRISLVQQGRRPGVVEIVFFRGDINPQAIVDGCTVWKTNDPEISKRLATSFNRDRVAKREQIDADVVAREGELLSITVADEAGHSTRVSWDRLLERAEKFPATMEIFRAQFGRLGDTPFELGAVTVNGEIDGVFPPVMIPKSVLNDLRRQAAAELLRQRDGLRHHAIAEPEALETMRGEAMSLEISPSPGAPGEGRGEGLRACNTSDANSTQPSPYPSPRVPGEGTGVRPTLNVLVRTMAQLDAVLACPVDSGGVERGMVYCEFEDVRQYSDAVKLARSSGVAIGLATVRIVKPHEHGLLATVAKAEPDAILVRNLAGLSYFAERSPQMPLIADYSLNVSNELTAAILARQGVRRMTPSYDLNWKQLSSLLARFSPLWFEAVIHQHMPMFHMEHCVFAHTLSNGKDYRDCGRPCEKHQVDLRDRAAAAHPLVADAGCRNTVYNGTAQSAAEFVPRMVALGLRQFRVELLREPAGAIAGILERYGRVLSGLDDGRTAWRQLKVLNQLGVTRGTLETAGA